MTIKVETRTLPEHFSSGWQPIATAPFNRGLELAVIDSNGTHALVFPCRRVLHGWLSAATHSSVNVHPTHWREWSGLKVGGTPRENELDRA